MKKTIKIVKYLLLLPALIVVYIISVFVFSYIPYNTSFVQTTKDPVTIYLRSNGVHTDIVVPLVSDSMNWNTLLPEIPPGTRYVSIGWGDKGFYLNTPTWSDLTFSTAFRAASGLSTTAMHVTYIQNIPALDAYTVKVDISKEQYRTLHEYILHSFKKDTSNTVIIVPHDARYYSGHFYDANGTYSIFKSCNTWVNIGLKKSGIRTPFWTPLDWPIINTYK